jgi:hypothetical protein
MREKCARAPLSPSVSSINTTLKALAMNRRAFMQWVGALVSIAAFSCATPSTVGRSMATREQSITAWRERIGSILAKGWVPIIDTEVTYNANYDLDFLMKNMDSLGVAQICPAPFAGMGSRASLDLHSRYPQYFIPTTADGSSPHWYHDPDNFVARLRGELATRHYFLMGEFEIRHYPSPLQYMAGRMDRDVTVPIDSPPVHKLFRLAIETGIAFQIHYEIEDVLLPPLEAMLSRYPEAKVIWCHLGQVRYRERAFHYSSEYVRGLLARFPNLYFDLGLPGPPHVHPATGQRDQMIYVLNGLLPWGGHLDSDWQKLLEDFPERFLAATDIGPDRYHGFPNQIMRLRYLVLNQLSERARHLIAYQNAWRLLTGEVWGANEAIQPIACSAG